MDSPTSQEGTGAGRQSSQDSPVIGGLLGRSEEVEYHQTTWPLLLEADFWCCPRQHSWRSSVLRVVARGEANACPECSRRRRGSASLPVHACCRRRVGGRTNNARLCWSGRSKRAGSQLGTGHAGLLPSELGQPVARLDVRSEDARPSRLIRHGHTSLEGLVGVGRDRDGREADLRAWERPEGSLNNDAATTGSVF